MDLGSSATLGQMSGMLSYSSDFNDNAQNAYDTSKRLMDAKVAMANTKGQAMGVYDKGSTTGEGISTGFTLAREAKNAYNFDSEIAGFGQGKGFSGYLASQSQLLRGRVVQAGARVRQAVGQIDEDEYKGIVNNPARLGLTQTTQRSNIQGPLPQETQSDSTFGQGRGATDTFESSTTTIGARDTSAGGALEFGREADKSAGIKAIEADPEAQRIASASGGLLGAVGGVGEAGLKGSFIKKVGQYASDLPSGQIGAIADVGGKVLGGIGAGEGIYDLATNKHKSGLDDFSDISDIASGALDAASLAMPLLAPVAGIANIASGIGDIFKNKEETQENAQSASANAPQRQTMQVGSLSSQGKVAQQSVSAY
jgi:hypothetical protein